MLTKIYRIKGSFVMGSETQVFTKEFKAINEEDIYEKLYSIFGSKHRIKRSQIKAFDKRTVHQTYRLNTFFQCSGQFLAAA